MGSKLILKKIIKAVLHFNLAAAIRLTRSGFEGLSFWIQRGRRKEIHLSGNESVQTFVKVWDNSIMLSREKAGILSYSKLCNLEDFRHPDLVPWLREIYAHEMRRFGPAFPVGHEDRRQWEIAMTIRTFHDQGVLHDKSEVLGVGAGNEPTIFYLTRRVRRVFATDLYLPYEGHWAEADVSMLANPSDNWPFAWNPLRLVTQHMDGRDLRYEDASFDGVFSSGSIEHFGSLDQIQNSIREIYRVLKPGGVLALATEFRVEGPGIGFPGIVMFTPELIQERIIGDLKWKLISPIDYSLSAVTRRTEVSQKKAMKAFLSHVRKHKRLLYHEYNQVQYPITLMRQDPYVWTSITIAMRKEG